MLYYNRFGGANTVAITGELTEILYLMLQDYAEAEELCKSIRAELIVRRALANSDYTSEDQNKLKLKNEFYEKIQNCLQKGDEVPVIDDIEGLDTRWLRKRTKAFNDAKACFPVYRRPHQYNNVSYKGCVLVPLSIKNVAPNNGCKLTDLLGHTYDISNLSEVAPWLKNHTTAADIAIVNEEGQLDAIGGRSYDYAILMAGVMAQEFIRPLNGCPRWKNIATGVYDNVTQKLICADPDTIDSKENLAKTIGVVLRQPDKLYKVDNESVGRRISSRIQSDLLDVVELDNNLLNFNSESTYDSSWEQALEPVSKSNGEKTCINWKIFLSRQISKKGTRICVTSAGGMGKTYGTHVLCNLIASEATDLGGYVPVRIDLKRLHGETGFINSATEHVIGEFTSLDRVILLMDGYENMAFECKKKLASEIAAHNRHQSKQPHSIILTSRYQPTEEAMRELRLQEWRLQPMDELTIQSAAAVGGLEYQDQIRGKKHFKKLGVIPFYLKLIIEAGKSGGSSISEMMVSHLKKCLRNLVGDDKADNLFSGIMGDLGDLAGGMVNNENVRISTSKLGETIKSFDHKRKLDFLYFAPSDSSSDQVEFAHDLYRDFFFVSSLEEPNQLIKRINADFDKIHPDNKAENGLSGGMVWQRWEDAICMAAETSTAWTEELSTWLMNIGNTQLAAEILANTPPAGDPSDDVSDSPSVMKLAKQSLVDTAVNNYWKSAGNSRLQMKSLSVLTALGKEGNLLEDSSESIECRRRPLIFPHVTRAFLKTWIERDSKDTQKLVLSQIKDSIIGKSSSGYKRDRFGWASSGNGREEDLLRHLLVLNHELLADLDPLNEQRILDIRKTISVFNHFCRRLEAFKNRYELQLCPFLIVIAYTRIQELNNLWQKNFFKTHNDNTERNEICWVSPFFLLDALQKLPCKEQLDFLKALCGMRHICNALNSNRFRKYLEQLDERVGNPQFKKSMNRMERIAISKLMFKMWVIASPRDKIYSLWEKKGRKNFDSLDSSYVNARETFNTEHFQEGAWHLVEATDARCKRGGMEGGAAHSVFNNYAKEAPSHGAKLILKQRAKAISLCVRFAGKNHADVVIQEVVKMRSMTNSFLRKSQKNDKYKWILQQKEFSHQINCAVLSNPVVRTQLADDEIKNKIQLCQKKIKMAIAKAFSRNGCELVKEDIRFNNVERLISNLFELHEVLLSPAVRREHELSDYCPAVWDNLIQVWEEAVKKCVLRIDIANQLNPSKNDSREETYIRVCEKLTSLIAKLDVLSNTDNLENLVEDMSKSFTPSNENRRFLDRLRNAKSLAEIHIELMRGRSPATKNVIHLKHQAPLFLDALMVFFDSSLMTINQTIEVAFHTIKNAYSGILPTSTDVETSVARQFILASVCSEGLPRVGGSRDELMKKYFPLCKVVGSGNRPDARWALSDLFKVAIENPANYSEDIVQAIACSARSAVELFLDKPEETEICAGDFIILACCRNNNSVAEVFRRIESFFIEATVNRYDVLSLIDHYTDALTEAGFTNHAYNILLGIIDSADHPIWKLKDTKKKLWNALAATCVKCAFHKSTDETKRSESLELYERFKEKGQLKLSEELTSKDLENGRHADYACMLRMRIGQYRNEASPDLSWAQADMGRPHDQIVGNMGIILARGGHYRCLLSLAKNITNPGKRHKYLPNWIQEATLVANEEIEYSTIYTVAKDFLGLCAGHPIAAPRILAEIYFLRKKLGLETLDYIDYIPSLRG